MDTELHLRQSERPLVRRRRRCDSRKPAQAPSRRRARSRRWRQPSARQAARCARAPLDRGPPSRRACVASCRFENSLTSAPKMNPLRLGGLEHQAAQRLRPKGLELVGELIEHLRRQRVRSGIRLVQRQPAHAIVIDDRAPMFRAHRRCSCCRLPIRVDLEITDQRQVVRQPHRGDREARHTHALAIQHEVELFARRPARV